MPWDIDFVPIFSRLESWLNGGAFPAFGTLSSVAAYNMPGLQWTHLPAYFLTRDPFWTMLVTMMLLNALSTWAIFHVGRGMFSPAIGLIAASLFAFSDVGISSSYISWGQQLLPACYTFLMLFLWQWRDKNDGRYLCLSGITATFAFMIHFSVLLLGPYVFFQIEREFVDIKAFLSEHNLVDENYMQQLAYLRPESGELLNDYRNPPKTMNLPIGNSSKTKLEEELTKTEQDFVGEMLRLPVRLINSISYGYYTTFSGFEKFDDDFVVLFSALMRLVTLLFWLACIRIAVRGLLAGRDILAYPVPPDMLLLMFFLVPVGALVLAGQLDKPSYFMGLPALQLLIVATLYDLKFFGHIARFLIVVFLMVFIGLHVSERLARLAKHDDAEYSPTNVGLYRHVYTATKRIAEDWCSEEPVTVSYDVLPEARPLWWVVAWNSVDPSYRLGMNFDFLLDTQFGLKNTNDSAYGLADDPDYIVVYGDKGRSRYERYEYDYARQGAIYVLKLRK
jgi:hypothetical protein